MQMTFEADGYLARPLTLKWSDADSYAQAAWKARYIVKRCSQHEAFFSDYLRNSPAAEQAVIVTLSKPDSWLWEVVRQGDNEIDIVGILRLSELQPGCSAMAHYFFFDSQLRDKTGLLQAWKRWAFDQAALHRVTVEVPAFAKALANHAKKHLGFIEEGCMRQAIKWHDEWHDVYVLGCVNDG